VTRFQDGVRSVLGDIASRKRTAVLVGGTGLYLRAVIDQLQVPGQWPDIKDEVEETTDTGALHHRLRELDAVAASRMEPTNRRRIVRALEVTLGSGRPFSSFGPGLDAYPDTPFHLVGIRVERDILRERIEARFRAMVDAGLVEEVRRLVARPNGLSRTARQALGYREVLAHVEAGRPLEECIDEAIRRTRQFARRQEAWFRRDPRIRWYESRNPLAVAEQVLGDWEDRCPLSS
jgi:tRNA dimethylallyltransferase